MQVEDARDRRLARRRPQRLAFAQSHRRDPSPRWRRAPPDGRRGGSLGLSERGRHRALKEFRTVADLAQEPEIRPAHLSEAIGFRVLDRHADNH
ncbi:MAG TPA: hypothetical protein VLS27_19215 [Gammaproteobacteria bacterium]|nr:hypothetical protein [Gammaproteobacteria bacterium]